ncbi:glycerate kinase [Paenibacillus phyllosphaerae]|uniref:Glycerate kinase n=1 Tax=Paenibacillus phyllosphaerae TaxID=274593 RepID=A0A7W5FPT3_9BACL|nr:glycerate kinase [Paenibacillus phyllosphaerae]MBB3112349.1 glycerate kinase [Paenibacillus phyllosphaerae]
MKVVVAPDSFKGSLSAIDAAKAIALGLRRAAPDVLVAEVPLADGGEGTLECLLNATGGTRVPCEVQDPLGRSITAAYGRIHEDSMDGPVAVIEMAQASGLGLIPEALRNPLITTTYGTGQLIRQALDDGCRRFILALGGSATNDGGAGMLQALGIRLVNRNGESVGYGGGQLGEIAAIHTDEWDSRIAQSEFLIASDVLNPLLGPQGASHVYGPQKGASPEIVDQLERHMTIWADIVASTTNVRLHGLPGAGAAGGLCGAFLAFFPATIRPGIDVVTEYAGLERQLADADLLLTGEGRLDSQTASGKALLGIVQIAKRHNVPALALAGSVSGDLSLLYEAGLTSAFSIVNGPMTLEEAMQQTGDLLADAAEQAFRTFVARRS